MPWTYNQQTGELSYGGHVIATGYSGFGVGKNNHALESAVNIGPVPVGRYDISRAFDSETHGIVCLHLSALLGTVTHGRGGFLIHGDSHDHPGAASHGCVILPRPVRLLMDSSPDRILEVV